MCISKYGVNNRSYHVVFASVWGMKYGCSIVLWDRALVATRGQHLVGQMYSGEHKRCIWCAKFPLNCYWSNCWTIKSSLYKSLVPRRNCTLCIRAFSYKSHIVIRCWCHWSISGALRTGMQLLRLPVVCYAPLFTLRSPILPEASCYVIAYILPCMLPSAI